MLTGTLVALDHRSTIAEMKTKNTGMNSHVIFSYNVTVPKIQRTCNPLKNTDMPTNRTTPKKSNHGDNYRYISTTIDIDNFRRKIAIFQPLLARGRGGGFYILNLDLFHFYSIRMHKYTDIGQK